MEVLFHFIFEIIKISILGSIYACLILLLFRVIAVFRPDSWFARTSEMKLKFWFKSGFLVSISLFIFMFTYWGDHGLGDSSRIPIGQGKSLNQINGTMTYINPQGYEYEHITLKEFALTPDFLIGKADMHMASDEVRQFAIWNLKTNKVDFVDYDSELEEYIQKVNIESNLDFKDFYEHYRAYWGGWRFWLLA